MSDEPNGTIRIPYSFLWKIAGLIVTALITGKWLQGDAPRIQTANMNRSLQNEYDLAWALRDTEALDLVLKRLDRIEAAMKGRQ